MKEEDVQPPQPDRLDGEEVDCEHAVRLRAEELAPGEPGALPGRSETSLAKQLAHSRGRHSESEPTKLAGDPLVAPARVLTREAQNQLTDLAADRRPTNSTVIGPPPRHQPAVPAKQRRRRDDKRPPAGSRKQLAGGGKEHSICGSQLGPSYLTPQHREFVAEHDDLELLELVRSKTQRRELQNTSKHDVAERPEQRPAPSMTTGRAPDSTDQNWPSRCGTELTHPTGRASNHTGANRFRTTRYTDDQSNQPCATQDYGPEARTAAGSCTDSGAPAALMRLRTSRTATDSRARSGGPAARISAMT
jgi:hypothetical protein